MPKPIEGDQDLTSLIVRPVVNRKERHTWRALVDRYHYLGEGVMCGEHLLYFALLGGEIVACIGWGAASLRNPKRDAYLGVPDFETMKSKLPQVTNNLRYLILPWVRVRNLGSKVLALNLARLTADWQTRYGHPVHLAETFVDTSRFHGTVYKASNWVHIGDTAGKQKRGYHYSIHGQTKAIYVYPLEGFREFHSAGN